MRILSTPDGVMAGRADFPFARRYAYIPDGDGGRLRGRRALPAGRRSEAYDRALVAWLGATGAAR